jgi:hypothetical protein
MGIIREVSIGGGTFRVDWARCQALEQGSILETNALNRAGKERLRGNSELFYEFKKHIASR